MKSPGWRNALVFAVALSGIAAAALLEPIAQDLTYHRFADTRPLAGMPNFANVVSNLPFLLIGVWGLAITGRLGSKHPLRLSWRIFFAGLCATAAGSAWYHVAPDNPSLTWDRLPMTIAFMSFFAIVIGEYVSLTAARRLLVPLLAAGSASVLYWAHTEAGGAGDLRPYAIVQFLPMLLIPLVVLLNRDRSDLGSAIGWMIVFYAAAKLGEFFDAPILAFTGFVSGHTLKHLLAAIATLFLLLWLRRKTTVTSGDAGLLHG